MVDVLLQNLIIMISHKSAEPIDWEIQDSHVA